MRSPFRKSSLIAVAAAAGMVFLTAGPSATAQTVFDQTYSPPVNTGGWIYNVAELMLVLGSLLVILVVFGYLRFSPKFRATEGDTLAVRAPKVDIGAVAARPAAPAPKPIAAAVAAPVATAPATAPVAAPVAAAPAATPAVAAAPATAPAAAPASERPAHVEPDEETFDRVLKEQLDKGVDRRVAEGRARSAAVVAARKKAGG